MSIWILVAIALGSAALACAGLGVWMTLWLKPRLARQFDEEFKQRLDEAADVLAARVEEAVRRGVMDGFTRLASKEVLEGTTRTIAKTGADIVEEGLGRILGRRGRRDRNQE